MEPIAHPDDMPDVDLHDDGSLHLSNLWRYGEVDVLYYEVTGGGDMSSLVVGGKVHNGTYSCPSLPNAKKYQFPVQFIIRLASSTNTAVYFRVFVNEDRYGQSITVILL